MHEGQAGSTRLRHRHQHDLALGDGEAELALLERQGGAAEHFQAPAAQRRDVRRIESGDRLQVGGGGDQPLCDVVLLALEFQQHAQKLHQRPDTARQLGRRLDLRQQGLGQLERRAHRVDHRRGARPIQRDPPELGDVLGRARPIGGELEQQIVAHDAVARQIAPLRLALAPGRQRLHDRQEARLARAQLDPPPGLVGRLLVGVRIGEAGQLLGDPLAAPGLPQLRLEALVDHAQMDDVGQRIVELLLAQRPARPVGEARALVDPRLRQPRDQGLVADLLAIAADHGGELGVEQRPSGSRRPDGRRSRRPDGRRGRP